MKWLTVGLAALVAAGPLSGQSLLERSPNVHGVWTLPSGNAAFVLAHRFEFQNGGDELFNIPTLTAAVGLPLGFTAGLDYSSYSEVVPGHLAGNETQYWVKRALRGWRGGTLALLGAYNSAAGSWDGAVNVRQEVGRVGLFAEGRGFTDRFGRGDPGAAAAVGASLRLTPHLVLTGDVGRVLDDDSVPSAWSAGVALEIPGSPHTMSLQATNSGALTLQGASREKVIGREGRTRYGFVFTVPLGGASRWLRIFRPAGEPSKRPTVDPAAPAAPDSADATVEIRMIAYTPAEITIERGQTVEWINLDPVDHTVTAQDGGWGSELLSEGERYSRKFEESGRYPYYCTPHPQMRGVVVVR